MLKYSRYLVFNFFKRIGVYAIFLASIVFISVFLIMNIYSHNRSQEMSQTQIPYVTNSPNVFLLFFVFLIMVMFLVLIIIHIFKDGEKNGTELLIVSKPLSRITIIFSKFISAIFLLFVWQLLTLFIYFGSSMFDKNATNNQIFVFSASLSLGGFVVGLLILSILILFSSFMGRIGIAIVSIFFAAIIPVISLIIQPLTNSSVPGSINVKKSVIGSSDKLTNNKTSNDIETIYLDDLPEKDSLTQEELDNSFIPFLGEWTNYENQTSYGNFVYFDFWYQWSQFYSTLIKEKNINDPGGKIKKIVRDKKINNDLPKNKYIKLNSDKKYIVFFPAENENKYQPLDATGETINVKLNKERASLKTFLEKAFDPNESFKDLELLVVKAVRNFFSQSDFSFTAQYEENWTRKKFEIELKNDNLQDALKFLSIVANFNNASKENQVQSFGFTNDLKNIDTFEQYISKSDYTPWLYPSSDPFNIDYLTVEKMPFWAYKDVIENNHDQNILKFQNKDPMKKRQAKIDFKNIFALNQEIPIFEVKPWISTWVVIAAWTMISLLILSFAVFMYLRKDFK